MSLLSGSCQADIAAARQACWAVLADVDSWPRWQRMLERVQILERDEQGRPSLCEAVIDAKLFKPTARVRVGYEPPGRLTFTLAQRGGELDALEGTWALEELSPERTRATYSLAVDPGPLGFMARRMERVIRPAVMGHQAEELAAEVARRRAP